MSSSSGSGNRCCLAPHVIVGQSDHTVLVRRVSSTVAGGVAALAAVLPCVRPAMALAALLARDGFVPRGPSSQDLLEGGPRYSGGWAWVGPGGPWRWPEPSLSSCGQGNG